MQAANSFVCHVNPIPDMSLGFLLWITSYIIERRGISLESQISTIFVVFNILILNCYSCVICSVVPNPRGKLLLAIICLYSPLQRASTITDELFLFLYLSVGKFFRFFEIIDKSEINLLLLGYFYVFFETNIYVFSGMSLVKFLKI